MPISKKASKAELKDYIKEKGLKKQIPLTQSKSELIKQLDALGFIVENTFKYPPKIPFNVKGKVVRSEKTGKVLKRRPGGGRKSGAELGRVARRGQFMDEQRGSAERMDRRDDFLRADRRGEFLQGGDAGGGSIMVDGPAEADDDAMIGLLMEALSVMSTRNNDRISEAPKVTVFIVGGELQSYDNMTEYFDGVDDEDLPWEGGYDNEEGRDKWVEDNWNEEMFLNTYQNMSWKMVREWGMGSQRWEMDMTLKNILEFKQDVIDGDSPIRIDEFGFSDGGRLFGDYTGARSEDETIVEDEESKMTDDKVRRVFRGESSPARSDGVRYFSPSFMDDRYEIDS